MMVHLRRLALGDHVPVLCLPQRHDGTARAGVATGAEELGRHGAKGGGEVRFLGPDGAPVVTPVERDSGEPPQKSNA